ncbi:MAG: lipopolysaccharide assembly protein LapA domain-containing protein [candidate division WOR-3 bacterium]
MKKLQIFIYLLILIFILVLIFQNKGEISIKLLTYEFYVSKILLLLLFLSLGFILGVLVSFFLVKAGKKT